MPESVIDTEEIDNAFRVSSIKAMPSLNHWYEFAVPSVVKVRFKASLVFNVSEVSCVSCDWLL